MTPANSSSPNSAPFASALSDTLYADLRGIAQRLFASERTGHTLQPTAVVNEACLRLMSCGLPEVPREQQLALAARALRQVLIDHARMRDADKRGGGAVRLELDAGILAGGDTLVDFEALRAALDRLRTLSDRQAEVVTLKIFSGLTMDQIAAILGISKRAAEGDWTVARAWLRRELEARGPA
jgi:RNA polymerase sigma factor (TIGR02999 family)